MCKRVVVTGLGVISCIGNDIATFRNSLMDGVCGIDIIDEFPVENLAVRIGGKIKGFDPSIYGLEKPFVRKQDRFSVYAAAAAVQAMNGSGLRSGENIEHCRLCTYISSGCGGFETIRRETEKIIEDPGGQWVSPNFVPTMIGNMAAAQVAIRFGAQGSCLDIVTACSSSGHALGEAFRAIRHGYADAVIAGGTECCTIPLGIAGFANAKAITRAEDPKYACLPFNARRAGFVMADGAAVLILEEYGHAISRGAKIYAEMVGYGTTCDAYHATAPKPDAEPQAACIRAALDQAGFRPESDTLYVNAHGTGTILNDITETKALKLALGEYARNCHISSTKSMHGHMFGAAGAAEAIATILALDEGRIPPTINLDCPDPECDLDYTPCTAEKASLTLGISNSFGFGGHNACLAFRKPNNLLPLQP